MQTILIVDDDATNLALGRKILETRYKVVCVLSGKRAIEYLEQYTPDLILLDIKMPNMDGFETFHKIRESKNGLNVPIMFLTACNDQEIIKKGIMLGVKDYIIKPFVGFDILQRIEKALAEQ